MKQPWRGVQGLAEFSGMPGRSDIVHRLGRFTMRSPLDAHDPLHMQKYLHIPLDKGRQIFRIICISVDDFPSEAPIGPLNKGAGSELANGSPSKNNGREAPVPFFQHPFFSRLLWHGLPPVKWK